MIPNLFLLGPTIINGRTEEEYKSTIHKDIWMTEDFYTETGDYKFWKFVFPCGKIEEVGLNDDSLLLIMWIMNGVGERRVKGLSMASPKD